MILALFGGAKDFRRTPFPAHEQMIAAFGAIEVDLSHVQLPEHSYLSGLAFCGGIKITVPRGTQVNFRGFALFGAREYKQAELDHTSDYHATVTINAVAIFGGIEVIEV